VVGRTVSPFITTPPGVTVTVGDYYMIWTRRILELGCGGPAGLWQSHGPLRKCSSCDAAATPEIFPPSSVSATRSWPHWQATAVPVAAKGPGRCREVAMTRNYQLASQMSRSVRLPLALALRVSLSLSLAGGPNRTRVSPAGPGPRTCRRPGRPRKSDDYSNAYFRMRNEIEWCQCGFKFSIMMSRARNVACQTD
jgi:hypothetical protein